MALLMAMGETMRLTPYQDEIYRYICRTRSVGEVVPSVHDIAAGIEVKVVEMTIYTALRILASKGLLERVQIDHRYPFYVLNERVDSYSVQDRRRPPDKTM